MHRRYLEESLRLLSNGTGYDSLTGHNLNSIPVRFEVLIKLQRVNNTWSV